MNLNRCFLISQNISADLKGPKAKYKLHYGRCTGPLFRMPHGTTPAAVTTNNQRTNGPVNAHLISWPSKAQNIQNLEKYMVKK